MPHLDIIAPRTAADRRIGRGVAAFLSTKLRGVERRETATHVCVRVPWQSQDDLQLALAALTVWNFRAMQARPLPPLYAAGVRYKREPVCFETALGHYRCEEWLTAHEAFARRAGDCEDLSSWRAAELMHERERARARARRSSVGWHIVVCRADGAIEDPSRRLGMGRKGA